MNRRQIDDRVMRDSIAETMCKAKARREFMTVESWQVLDAGIDQAADACARHLTAGRTGLAYAAARVHAQLLASQARMFARRS